MAESSKKKTFKVSAVMVTAKTDNDRIVYLYRGDVVGADVSSESFDHLKSLGFITDDDDVDSTPPPAPAA